MIEDTYEGSSTTLRRLRVAAVIDLLMAGGVFLKGAIVAPDAGVTSRSLRHGLVLATVFGAAPIAALARGIDSATVVALGGGMTVAGAATTPGGNLLGPVMALCGLLLLLMGASRQPTLTAGMIGRLLGYAIALGAAMWLALGTMALSGIASLALAVVIAASTRWGSLNRGRN